MGTCDEFGRAQCCININKTSHLDGRQRTPQEFLINVPIAGGESSKLGNKIVRLVRMLSNMDKEQQPGMVPQVVIYL
jgi:hypothetical protein